MIAFTATIKKFQEHGDKTGWSYIMIPEEVALQIKPANRKAFKVQGFLDSMTISGMTLLPMGEGDFMLTLKAEIRKKLGKNQGANVSVKLQEDMSVRVIPDWLTECLEDEPDAGKYFYSLVNSHQDYFIKWIESAKTEATKTKRLAMSVNAFNKKMDFGQMIRFYRDNPL